MSNFFGAACELGWTSEHPMQRDELSCFSSVVVRLLFARHTRDSCNMISSYSYSFVRCELCCLQFAREWKSGCFDLLPVLLYLFNEHCCCCCVVFFFSAALTSFLIPKQIIICSFLCVCLCVLISYNVCLCVCYIYFFKLVFKPNLKIIMC